MTLDHKCIVGSLSDQARAIPSGFECGEVRIVEEGDAADDDEDEDAAGGDIEFFCTVPTPKGDDSSTTRKQQRRLVFRCRGRSVGVLSATQGDQQVLGNIQNKTFDNPLKDGTHEKKDLEDNDDADDDEEAFDPFFFDEGYTLAGRTGFQVWAGSRLMLEALLYPTSIGSPPDDTPPTRLQHWQQRLVHQNNRILELGSGVGLVGASLAAVGNQVLLTDLATLVDHSVLPNLRRNSHKSWKTSGPPGWLSAIATDGKCSVPTHCVGTNDSNSKINNVGWMGATALDWTKPLTTQIRDAEALKNLDLIVASDCVWLTTMLESLLNTVSSLFQITSPSTSFILSLQRRDKNGHGCACNDDDDKNIASSPSSSMFTTVEGVLQAIEARGWQWECLAWRYTLVEAEEHEKEDIHGLLRREVYIFEVRQQCIEK